MRVKKGSFLLIHSLSEWLNGIGLIGLFLTMFIEGASIPFPGIVVVLAYGYMMPLNILEASAVAAGMSFFYSIASLIPYAIAYKLENLLPSKLKRGVKKARNWFHKYGVWSIALARPFGVGNYISYVAGLTKVGPLRFLCLTFIGIFPWALAMLIIGDKTVPVIEQYLRNAHFR